MKTPVLKIGATVAIVTPSWAGPNSFPQVFDLGIERLKSVFGLNVKELPSTRASKERLYNDPKLRAEDIMSAFEDPEVSLVIASIGGNDSIRILPHLDISRLTKNPKMFMGFSDSTTLLTFLNQQGLITLHGPSVMAGFAEPGKLQQEFIDHVHNFLFEPWESFEYKPFKTWTEDKASWKDQDFFKKIKEYHENEGWRVIQGHGEHSGKLYGGNLEILEMTKGTKFMENTEHLKGTFLFLETSEEKPSISYITYALRSMGVRGVFNSISGILFGRAKDYSPEEKEEIYKTIKKVISQEFNKTDLPIVVNMDFGHTQPQWILPLGVQVVINLDKKTFIIKE